MRYLRRKADLFLEEWKARKDHLPLIVRGARQIGKTETIRRFARAHYASVVELNFITNPSLKGITENGFSVASIIRLISLMNPLHRFPEGKTLIFFDEVQAFPEIVTSLKFFAEDGRYDVICSGSLLGIQYMHVASISVGYQEDYQMFSMDFEEFLWAKGYQDDTISQMLGHMCSFLPFPDIEHQRYADLFLEYCILGGMPHIVSTFIEQGTFERVLALQKQLLFDYESDIRKYAESLDQARIIHLWRSLPFQLAKENKKFQYSKIAKGARAKDYLGGIDWLSDAGLVNLCYQLVFPELPVKGNMDDSRFKVYYADTGLLVASLDEEAQTDLRANRNLGVYKGAMYENFAAEALVKQGYPLCYYKRENSTLEEDFFIRSANELIPVEVKANQNQAKSLSLLVHSDRYPDIRHGIKFTTGNVGLSLPLISFPFYCLFLLKRFMKEQSICT